MLVSDDDIRNDGRSEKEKAGRSAQHIQTRWSVCLVSSLFQLPIHFLRAVAYIAGNTEGGLSNDTRLKFYALFKQATDGPCT